MILFFLLSAALVIVALVVLLSAALRAPTEDNDQEQQNITIARERLLLLQGALDSSDIDADTFAQEKSALERSLASDLAGAKKTTQARGGLSAAALVAVFIPLASGALYLKVGTPAALSGLPAAQQTTPQGDPTAAATPGTLAELLPGLEQRLAENPDDVRGWLLLGRSYLMVGEFAKADQALTRAKELDPHDVAIVAQLAEAKAMQADGVLAGEPLVLLEEAVIKAPENPQILWLLANARQQQNDHTAALEHLGVLQQVMSHDADALQSIDEMINTSRSALGLSALPATQPQQPIEGIAANATPPTNESPSDEPPLALEVTVTIAPEALEDSAPQQTVFVYARAMQGPPMPLAVARTTVGEGEVPTTVELSNAMAMMPELSLSSFDRVRIGARISSTGSATPKAGDWFGEVSDVSATDGTAVSVVIDSRRP